MKRSQPKRATARAKADKAFSLWVRERDGRCVVRDWFPAIACNGRLQCCHVVSRRYHAVRWVPENAVAGCAAHHLYGTHHPLEWEEAVKHAGIDLNNLRYLALNDPPQDPDAVLEWLKGDGA